MRIEFSAPIPRALGREDRAEGIRRQLTSRAFEENKGEGGVGLLTMVQRGYRKSILFFGKSSRHASIAILLQGRRHRSAVHAELSRRIPISASSCRLIFKDETDRPLTNIADFPIKTRTALAPPIAKFATALVWHLWNSTPSRCCRSR
jgi:hypothetical protein